MVDPAQLPGREAAVLCALLAGQGRVLSRRELAEAAGLRTLSARRVDAVLVSLRRRLPPGALVTVRSRGWLISDPSFGLAAHPDG